VRTASRPLIGFPLKTMSTSSPLNAEFKIATSLLSKPMMARYNASVMASRSVREVRICACDMVKISCGTVALSCEVVIELDYFLLCLTSTTGIYILQIKENMSVNGLRRASQLRCSLYPFTAETLWRDLHHIDAGALVQRGTDRN